MFQIFNIHHSYNVIIISLLLFYLNCPISAISCYDCSSTFPSNSICLPACSQTTKANSTCLLTRSVQLDLDDPGSLNATHLIDDSFLSNAAEKYFLYGEEAVYLNPSSSIGWDWEYGPITYGCDMNGCNNPEIVNSLPNALNARIPTTTLNQLLNGEIDSSCYHCDKCLDLDVTDTNMAGCDLAPCRYHSCNFVATHSPTVSPGQCSSGWRFISGCLNFTNEAQLDMNIMYYPRSNKHQLYKMAGICLSDNCNNITTFKKLKESITIDPDLSCLTATTTTSTTTRSTTTSGTTSRTTSSLPLITTSRDGSVVSTTASSNTPTTTSDSSIQRSSMMNGLFGFLFLFFIFI